MESGTSSDPRSVRPGAVARWAAALVAVALAAGGCGGDDDGTVTVDAAVDAPACVLASTTVDCLDDTPCKAMCGEAYCYNFMQVGQVCTQPCMTIDDCPGGWTCNNMGRCRPPG